MISALEVIVFIFLIGLAGWLAWRLCSLRRAVQAYTHAIHLISEQRLTGELPKDVRGLENLSKAIYHLVSTLGSELRTVEAEHLKLASILEQMSDGVLIADPEGHVIFLNPAAKRIFKADGAIGKTVAQVIRQYQLVEVWERSRATSLPQEQLVELPAQRQFLQLLVQPDPRTGSSLLLVQDLTRMRRLETVRRDFISNISHELRTPLASLKALTETLRDGALSDPEVASHFLGRIETEVDALSQMTQELLDLSRIESGQVDLDVGRVNPVQLLETAAERMRAQAERAGLTLIVETAVALPEIRADGARTEQVLVNLIHNAVKFTPPRGTITLSAQTDGPFIRFAVKDTGIGIPEDKLERIFERFYKADRSRSGGGTGLGLSIARHIVELHGGKIWAESREGEGSTFFFTIPRCSD